MPEARREELLGRLADLVLREGFARLTIDDIAGRLQCSKSTLYGISASREQLVAAAVRHFFREATERIEARVDPVAPVAERISAYVTAVGTELSRMSPDFYVDMVTSDATVSIYEGHSEAAAKRVARLIEEGVTTGDFRDVDAEFVGAAASLLIDGVRHGQLLTRTGLTPAEAYARLGELLTAAVAIRSGTRRSSAPGLLRPGSASGARATGPRAPKRAT
jgi:AcrR family transcriptional regulator